MSKLNGDSQQIVELLTEKINDSNKQITKRIDDFIETNNRRIDKQEKLEENHCQRIRKLEGWKSNLIGKLSVLVAMITVVISYILK